MTPNVQQSGGHLHAFLNFKGDILSIGYYTLFNLNYKND